MRRNRLIRQARELLMESLPHLNPQCAEYVTNALMGDPLYYTLSDVMKDTDLDFWARAVAKNLTNNPDYLNPKISLQRLRKMLNLRLPITHDTGNP